MKQPDINKPDMNTIANLHEEVAELLSTSVKEKKSSNEEDEPSISSNTDLGAEKDSDVRSVYIGNVINYLIG